MGEPKYPCDDCTYPESSFCKRCAKWKAYYLYRQSLINAFAERLERYWRYYLPGDDPPAGS